jgi:hypothetical protein
MIGFSLITLQPRVLASIMAHPRASKARGLTCNANVEDWSVDMLQRAGRNDA